MKNWETNLKQGYWNPQKVKYGQEVKKVVTYVKMINEDGWAIWMSVNFLVNSGRGSMDSTTDDKRQEQKNK